MFFGILKTHFQCKESVEATHKAHTVILNKCVIEVKNAPSFVCKQCGEVYFEDNVVQNLEAIIARLKNSTKKVAVVEYADNIK